MGVLKVCCATASACTGSGSTILSSNQITTIFPTATALSPFLFLYSGRNSVHFHVHVHSLLFSHSTHFPFSPLPATKKATRIPPAMGTATGSGYEIVLCFSLMSIKFASFLLNGVESHLLLFYSKRKRV